MNWSGLALGFVTLFLIGLGFVWVSGDFVHRSLFIYREQLGFVLAWHIQRVADLGFHRVEGAGRARGTLAKTLKVSFADENDYLAADSCKTQPWVAEKTFRV